MNRKWLIIMMVGAVYGIAPAFLAVLITLLTAEFLSAESIIPVTVFVIAFLIAGDVVFLKMAKGRVKIKNPFRVSTSIAASAFAALLFVSSLILGFMVITFFGRSIFGIELNTPVIALTIALSAGFGIKYINAFEGNSRPTRSAVTCGKP